MFKIGQVQPDDRQMLYQICLQTADNGDDATSEFIDPLLPGHVYVGPYLAFEPELCLVLTDESLPKLHSDANAAVGYVLGTSDSIAFYRFGETVWFPPLRNHYPVPADDDSSRDASLIRSIHRGHFSKFSHDYPAHLHIDLLPQVRGQGFGKKLMAEFLGILRQMDVPGVHLQVGPANTSATGFYQHLGFRPVHSNDRYIEMALTL